MSLDLHPFEHSRSIHGAYQRSWDTSGFSCGARWHQQLMGCQSDELSIEMIDLSQKKEPTLVEDPPSSQG